MKILFQIALYTFLLFLASQFTIKIPSTDIAPTTAQSLAVLVMACIFPNRASLLGLLLYLLLGAFGIPVFAYFNSGFEVLYGKTSGYLLGFILATLAIQQIQKRWKDHHHFKELIFMLSGTIIILISGYVVLSTFIGIKNAFDYGILPFLPGALIKIILGFLILKLFYQLKAKWKVLP